jgi:hypothetical protein
MDRNPSPGLIRETRVIRDWFSGQVSEVTGTRPDSGDEMVG